MLEVYPLAECREDKTRLEKVELRFTCIAANGLPCKSEEER